MSSVSELDLFLIEKRFKIVSDIVDVMFILNISKEELMNFLNIDIDELDNILSGTYNFDIDTLNKIKYFLKIEL